MNYKLKLNRSELDFLAWVGDRYESAAILYDGLQLADSDDKDYFGDRYDKTTEFLWLLPEHIAWEYRESLDQENGCGMTIPPCIGGTLGAKLATLYDEIV